MVNPHLYYVVDDFIVKEFPTLSWVRYADGEIAHYVFQKQEKYLWKRLEQGVQSYGLELNQEETRIVYCKDDNRRGNNENISFDFLDYIFFPKPERDLKGGFSGLLTV